MFKDIALKCNDYILFIFIQYEKRFKQLISIKTRMTKSISSEALLPFVA